MADNPVASVVHPFHCLVFGLSIPNMKRQIQRFVSKTLPLSRSPFSVNSGGGSLRLSAKKDNTDEERERRWAVTVSFLSSEWNTVHPLGSETLSLLSEWDNLTKIATDHPALNADFLCFHAGRAGGVGLSDKHGIADVAKVVCGERGVVELSPGDRDAASVLERSGADVLIALNGWTRGERMRMLSLKPVCT